MRHIPRISLAISKLLAQYEDQAHYNILPGKDAQRCKSGRYDTTETTTVRPELRWPNEGYVATSQTRKRAYDDLSVTQLASGQLNNILLIQDANLIKQMLTQITMALTDAVSLPWPAVRAACNWATWMIQIEVGRLS